MNRVVVVGGGLVGCLLSAYLARRGVAVTIYERNRDVRRTGPATRPSISLTLCARGFRSLERIGVMDRVSRLLSPAFGRMIHAVDGTVAYQPYSDFGDALYCVSRRDLCATLLDMVEERGVRVHFERRLVDLDPVAGEIVLEDAGGHRMRERAACIVGADGCFSAVRRRLHALGLCSQSEELSDIGYKELRIPAEIVDTRAVPRDVLHVWPRRQLMAVAFAERDGSCTASVHLPLHGPTSFQALREEADVIRLFEGQFPDLLPLVPDLAARFLAQRPNPLVTIRCRPWTAGGKVLLIGDAAHGMLPYYGQGANAGFQDCEILDNLLARHGFDWPRVITQFEAIRKPDADAIADLCVEHVTILRDLVARPEYQMRCTLERRLQQLWPDTFAPLYAMVTFTSMSYAEARRRDQVQRRVVDDLLRDAEIQRMLREPAEHEAFVTRARDAIAMQAPEMTQWDARVPASLQAQRVTA